MDRQDTCNHVAAALHDAVPDDTRWATASGMVETACRSRGKALVFGDRGTEDVRIFMPRF